MTKKLLIFPWKLHELLNDVEHNNQSDIISWTPGGTSFKVHDKERFCNEIMPNFFAGASPQFKTFQRSLNLWGFKYVDSSSLHNNKRGNQKSIEYSHDCFVQGNPDMCLSMKRVRVQGIRSRPFLRNPVAAIKKKKKKKTKIDESSTKKKVNKKSSDTKKKSASKKVAKNRPVELDEESFSPTNSENAAGSGVAAVAASAAVAVAAAESNTGASTTMGDHQLVASSNTVVPAAAQQSSGSSDHSPLVEMLLQRLLGPTGTTPQQQDHRQDAFHNLGGLTEPPGNAITSLAHLLAGDQNREQQLGSSVVGTTPANGLLSVLNAISMTQQQQQRLLQQQQYHSEPLSVLPSSPPIANPLGLSNNDQIHQLLQTVNHGNVIPHLPQPGANNPFSSLFSTAASSTNGNNMPQIINNGNVIPHLPQQGANNPFFSLFALAPAPVPPSNGYSLTERNDVVNLLLAQVLGMNR